MASLTEILTAINNLASATTRLYQTNLNIQGAQSKSAISTATVVKAASGRVCQIAVTTAGSTTGAVYDANVTGVTTQPIYTIPTATGSYTVNMPTNLGIVIVPGTSMVVAVSFS